MDKFAMIIFGASGDLTKRKLMPALYSLYPVSYTHLVKKEDRLIGVIRVRFEVC